MVVGPGARVVVGAIVGELWCVVAGATVVTVVVTAGTVPGAGTVFDDLPWLEGLPDGARVVGVDAAAAVSPVGVTSTVVSGPVVTAASVASGGSAEGSLSFPANVRTDTVTRAVDTTARYAMRAKLNDPIERTH